jgi:transposase-like protein
MESSVAGRSGVELTLHGRSVQSVAIELGLSSSELYRWRKEYAPPPGGGGGGGGPPIPATRDAMEAEIRRLRAEVVRLQDREIRLKKFLGILSELSESGLPGLRH